MHDQSFTVINLKTMVRWRYEKMTIEYRNIHGNRTYKSSLFCMAFENVQDLLDLYNAINNSNYTDASQLKINTIENVLYISMKNDVSFMFTGTMNLYEHQSTKNENMPLRGFLYFARLFEKYLAENDLDIYSSRIQKIPTPKYIVFYNGRINEPDQRIMRLSDAFEKEGGCLECEARLLNINYGRNREIMEKCKRLEEYAMFVAAVRKYALDEKMSRGEAITCAIDECIQNGILVDVLREQRTEVVMYILESFDKEIYERDLKAEAIAEGLAEGRAQGRAEGVRIHLKEQIQKKLLKGKNVEEIAEELEEPLELIEELMVEVLKA